MNNYLIKNLIKKYLSIILLTLFASLLIVSIVEALTVTSLGGGKYNVTFNNGRTALVYNVVWNNPQKTLSFNVNTTDGRGLRIIDMIEARAYAETLVGRANNMDKTKIIIR